MNAQELIEAFYTKNYVTIPADFVERHGDLIRELNRSCETIASSGNQEDIETIMGLVCIMLGKVKVDIETANEEAKNGKMH